MGFETIENCAASRSQQSVPPGGVRVSTSKIAKRGGGTGFYISLVIGVELARKLVFKMERLAVDLSFGTGRDAGKIRIAVNTTTGGFTARRRKSGDYLVTISQASAEGLFALDFPRFTVPLAEIEQEAGKPPAAIFAASAEMLAVED